MSNKVVFVIKMQCRLTVGGSKSAYRLGLDQVHWYSYVDNTMSDDESIAAATGSSKHYL
jgi:hypothetical protein